MRKKTFFESDIKSKNNVCSIPKGFTSIAPNTFSGDKEQSQITEVNVPNTVQKIDDYAFFGNKQIETVNFEDTKTTGLFKQKHSLEIGNNALSNCKSLTSFTAPNNLTKIGEAAFLNCEGLTTVQLSEKTTDIGANAFQNCSSLQSINIPEGTTTIKESAFSGCSQLEHIDMPRSLSSIETNAFSDSKINTFSHDGDLSKIGSNAFQNCSNLERVNVLGKVDKIESGAFSGAFWLEQANFGDVEEIGDDAFNGCAHLKEINGLVNTKSIGKEAFNFTQNLTHIKLPETLENLGSSAFFSSGIQEINIPSNVKTIKKDTFSNCNNLKHVEFTDGLETIESNSFNRCENLESPQLPKTLKTIDSSAFRFSGIEEAIIPDSVTKIGEQAFENCPNLKKVVLPDNLKEIEFYTFNGCPQLNDVHLPKNIETISSHAFSGTNIEEINIEGENLNLINSSAFEKCSKLKHVKANSDVALIGDFAFYNCENLETIDFNNISKISAGAFYGCSNLKSIKGLEGLTRIDQGAFCGCKNLQSIDIPANCQIFDSSLENCNFNYMYARQNGGVGFSKEQPTNESGVDDVRDISAYTRSISDFSPSSLLATSEEQSTSIQTVLKPEFREIPPEEKAFVEFLDQNGFAMTNDEFKNWSQTGKIKTFMETADLTTYGEVNSSSGSKKKTPGFIEESRENDTVEERVKNFKMAYTMGCFSKEEVSSGGKRLPLSRAASQAINALNSSHTVSPQDIRGFFEVDLNTEDEQLPTIVQKHLPEFLLDGEKSTKKVIETEDGKKQSYYERTYPNIDSINYFDDENQKACEFITNIDNIYENYYADAMKEAETTRNSALEQYSLDNNISIEEAESNISPISTSDVWISAFESSLAENNNMLQGTEYEEHGNLYAGKKLSQESTNEVVGWYQEGKEKGIPQHILGKPLNKSTYIESLQDKLYTLEELEQGGCYLEDTTDDKITSLSKAFKEPKSSVEEMMQNVDSVIDDTTLNLIDIRETLDNLRASKFSFEMMPKDDPRNAIAGLTIADCCATVTGTSYGRDIARHTITDPNYQNIHIIDEVGKSAGKATLYVDKDSNTLLLNSIELRKKYRKGENDAGRYDSSPMSKPATDREQIFQTIIYGVHAYIIEHNQQNPNQPIQQVNVGWNFNRLKEQTERYDKVEKDSDEFITPPDDFVDASLEQYVIYRRGDKLLIPEIKTPKQNMETQDEDDYQLTKGGK